MANVNNTDGPFGFRAIKMLDSTPYNGGTLRGITATSGNAMFIGDALVPNTAATSDSNKSAAMGVLEAGVDDALLGFVVAFEPDFDDIGTIHRKASDARYVLISPGINVIHVAQADAAVALADVGAMNNIVVDNDGSTTTGLSGHEMDATSVGSTAQLQFMQRHHTGETEAAADTFPLVESRVNEQELGTDSAGT